jgi:hypothetical protein
MAFRRKTDFRTDPPEWIAISVWTDIQQAHPVRCCLPSFPVWNIIDDPRVPCSTGAFNMARSTGSFFAGVGTTFVALAVGFGGGLMIAKSALQEPGGYQSRAASAALPPVRVVLPDSAEAAQPTQQPQQQAFSLPEATQPPSPTQPAIQLAKQVQAPPEKPDTRQPKAEERERKRRYSERKARRQAAVRTHEQREQRQPRESEGPPIMAFDGDSSPGFGGTLFGN